MHLYKYGPYSEQNAKFNNKHVNSIRRWRTASVSLIKTSEKMLSPDTTLVTIRLHHIFDTFDTTPKCIPVIYRWEIAKQRNNTFRNFTSMYARRMNIWSMKKCEMLCIFFFHIKSLSLHFLKVFLEFFSAKEYRWPETATMHSVSLQLFR